MVEPGKIKCLKQDAMLLPVRDCSTRIEKYALLWDFRNDTICLPTEESAELVLDGFPLPTPL